MLDFTPDHLAPQPAALPGRFHSAADYTTQYRSGQLTPLQVVNGLLALITDRSSTGGSEHPVAWAEVRPDEVRAAAEASTQRWAAGTPLGPLDGVPIGVKCDTALRGHAKSLGLRRDAEKTLFRPVDESVWCVAKLVEAGAIPMGTLAMHEIGIGGFCLLSFRLEGFQTSREDRAQSC
jgi:Asp-tRNA(Asn)/Glu-tRNA(Gln) amidotransferase A subunit family amidase